MPHRSATERQLAALVKARAALVKKHTCERCGDEDPSRGLDKKSDWRIHTITQEGVAHRYCISCWLYFRWIDTRLKIEQQLHALFAERTLFLLLDTETTGTLESFNSQVVEIAVLNQDGQVLYQSLYKPDIPMPRGASEVNGLTDERLADAPTFSQCWPDLVAVLTTTDVPIYVWNADFDRAMLLRTAKRFGLPVPEAISQKDRWRCAMKLHARWYGEWSTSKNDYRWQRLIDACEDLEIAEDTRNHRAVGDAQRTLHVLRAIAQRNGEHPAPHAMPSTQRYYGD
jgi:DNA polymerase III subunit epsilon